MQFNKQNVTRWMRNNVEEHRDQCGEINTTSLAEDCAMHFDQNHEGGPLDDETHWIWDISFEVGSKAE